MDSGLTNQHQVILAATINPLKNFVIRGALAHFWFDETPIRAEKSKDIGNELDILLNYSFNEDLTFELLTAYFMPGSYWPEDQNDKALDVVGTMKLTF